MKRNFLKFSILATIFLLITSCDKDFNSLGSDLVDDTHFNLEKYDGATVVAYSKPTGAVQSNNLPVNALGIYKNPIFGTTKAQFVTQVQLASTNPILGTNITLNNATDSVYLYIPYFSRIDPDETEEQAYLLDSIYGNEASTLNLKIFRNGYVLRDFSPTPDPNDITSFNQRYFNNDKNLVESNLASPQLNDAASVEENTAFKFSKNQYIKYRTNVNGEWLDSGGNVTTDPAKRVVKERIAPGMWINLNKQYFKTNILDASSNVLINNNNFREYFKGLYFQIDENGGQDGALAMLDFSKGKIHIQYHSDITTTTPSGSTTTNAKRELVLNLTGNTVNFFEYDNDTYYQNKLSNSDEVNGDSQLFIKGGQGSVVYIDLFGNEDAIKLEMNDGIYSIVPGSNQVPDELDMLRANNRLINQANLTFYIDNSISGMNANVVRPKEPRRLYLYDATNNRALVDYTLDNSSTSDPKNNKFGFGGIMTYANINNNRNEPGILYKINITNYINNLINNEDKTLKNNYKLGLSVTESIAVSTNAQLRTPYSVFNPIPGDFLNVRFVPTGSIMNPLGTILYGSHSSVPEDKRLKLEIYYTKFN